MAKEQSASSSLNGEAGRLLSDKRAAILGHWRRGIIATYPPQAAKLLEEEEDRFRNPVGYFIRTGTEEVFDQILGAMDPEALRAAFDPFIRARAVQQFTSAEAVSFVFSLKKIVREALERGTGKEGDDGGLREFEERVDRAALVAFETYVQCREKLWRIRTEEVKNHSAVLLRRLNKGFQERQEK